MSSPLQSLYQEVILEHYRNPRNKGELEDSDVEIHMNNPTCGDEIVLQLRVRDERIEAVRFRGHGCSISQAAASMMTRQLEGRSLDDAHALTARFTEMMHGSEEAAADKSLGDLRALAGVAKFPVRVRCALLAWDALQQAAQKVRGG
ncbi:SUF system NifU family Fe-S cluster assembly protein [soil metagenome]|nr:SUF system NifU family Fe-S cluster assembly protein [Gemmatimonadota bacterium]